MTSCTGAVKQRRSEDVRNGAHGCTHQRIRKPRRAGTLPPAIRSGIASFSFVPASFLVGWQTGKVSGTEQAIIAFRETVLSRHTSGKESTTIDAEVGVVIDIASICSFKVRERLLEGVSQFILAQ